MPDAATLNTLLAEIGTWKHNRSSYPGWLIAPEAVRARLLDSTRRWIHHFLQLPTANLTLLQKLEMLFELNWRLETALIPVGDDLAPIYRDVINAINPFPASINDMTTATFVLSDTTLGDADWSLVRAQWLSLAFALMRYYREERRATEFEATHFRLGRIRDLDDDMRARWLYERCLFALADMDDGSCLLALSQWPETTRDPFWAVRKALVLAETGLTEKALANTETALEKLRHGLSDTVAHIGAMSREGWALWVSMGLKNNERHWRRGLGFDIAGREKVRKRFDQLKRFGCSPEEIVEYFDSRLLQPTPQAQEQAETRPGFQPGTSSRTMHFGDDMSGKLLPAYQYCRLVEDAAHPVGFGHTKMSKDSLLRVAEWLSEFDTVRTQSLMMRLCDKDLVDRYLSRHRIAALQSETVGKMKDSARRSIEQTVPTVVTAGHLASDEAKRAEERLGCALELLSRVCARDTGDALQQSWDLACRLYLEPGIRDGIRFGRALKNVFETVIQSTETAQLMARLNDLFRFPVPGEENFPVFHADEWPDPSSIAARRFSEPIWQRPPRGWDDTKRHLFVLVEGNSVAKRASFFRLITLAELGVLSTSDRRRLASAFWCSSDNRSRLPFEMWGPSTAWIALALPGPRGIRPPAIVRAHILSHEPGQVHGGMVSPDGFLDLITHTSRRQDKRSTSRRGRQLVDWSSNDIQRLFEKIQSWWQNHGQRMADELRSVSWRHAHDGPAIHRFLNNVWNVVREVIIPRMSRRQSSVAALQQLISGIGAAGLPIGAVLPGTLMLQPSELEGVSSRLRDEFANPGQEFYLSALRGIVFWVDRTTGQRSRRRVSLPDVPRDLLREVGTAVALRRPEALRLSLDCAYHMIRRLRENADRWLVENLRVGLEYLLVETEYREKDRPMGRHPYKEIPEIRRLSARLAKCLLDCGHVSDVTRRWTEAAAADVLPEIKRFADAVGEPDEE